MRGHGNLLRPYERTIRASLRSAGKRTESGRRRWSGAGFFGPTAEDCPLRGTAPLLPGPVSARLSSPAFGNGRPAGT
jgi:hypothetical protein